MKPLRLAVVTVGAAASVALLLGAFVLIVASEVAGRFGIGIMALLGAGFMGLGTWGLVMKWFPDGWPR
jgi:hypothetical protein